jgi:bifunctional non-homologous end joining protein LigD
MPTMSDEPRVANIKITSAERLVFDPPPVTKLEVVRYYADWSDRILPFLRNRPVSMLRCPEGTGKTCFFQKHRTDGMTSAINVVEVQGRDEMEEYMTLSTRRGLVGAAQMGVMEFHGWGARNDNLERPDRLIFDLDPDEGLEFEIVRDAALAVRERLDELGLPNGPMLSGGKGIHVVVPLRASAEWPDVKALTAGLARAMARDAPEHFTATMSKAKREGRIFIDWLRNERGATAVTPYSLRARKGATVAVPLEWPELAQVTSSGAFNIHSVAARLERECPLVALRRKAVKLGPRLLAEATRRWPADD